jgi:hypothetical protein
MEYQRFGVQICLIEGMKERAANTARFCSWRPHAKHRDSDESFPASQTSRKGNAIMYSTFPKDFDATFIGLLFD